jgi:hypothetical protein
MGRRRSSYTFLYLTLAVIFAYIFYLEYRRSHEGFQAANEYVIKATVTKNKITIDSVDPRLTGVEVKPTTEMITIKNLRPSLGKLKDIMISTRKDNTDFKHIPDASFDMPPQADKVYFYANNNSIKFIRTSKAKSITILPTHINLMSPKTTDPVISTITIKGLKGNPMRLNANASDKTYLEIKLIY